MALPHCCTHCRHLPDSPGPYARACKPHQCSVASLSDPVAACAKVPFRPRTAPRQETRAGPPGSRRAEALTGYRAPSARSTRQSVACPSAIVQLLSVSYSTGTQECCNALQPRRAAATQHEHRPGGAARAGGWLGQLSCLALPCLPLKTPDRVSCLIPHTGTPGLTYAVQKSGKCSGPGSLCAARATRLLYCSAANRSRPSSLCSSTSGYRLMWGLCSTCCCAVRCKLSKNSRSSAPC